MEPLDDEQVRVIACLVEKEATVPDSYPLTLVALRQACNQTSSRDPIVAYDDLLLQRVLDDLKVGGLVRFVHPAHGERVTRFRHVLHERLELGRPQLAVLAVLALRGPQTAVELRTRTERANAFGSVAEVDQVLAALAGREQPLVVALPRQIGQHQGRWAHLLAGPVDVEALASVTPSSRSSTPGALDRVAALEDEVAELRGRIDRLERELGMQLPS